MKTFDVFLRDELTEINVIISSLVNNEVLPFDSGMIIDCAAKKIESLRCIQGDTSMILDTELQRLSKKTHASAETKTMLLSNVDFTGKKFADLNHINMQLSTGQFDIYDDIKVISPQASTMYLSCEASAEILVLRTLEQMDGYNLSDFDNMSLQEIDIIIPE